MAIVNPSAFYSLEYIFSSIIFSLYMAYSNYSVFNFLFLSVDQWFGIGKQYSSKYYSTV